jgi:hypothetical protein
MLSTIEACMADTKWMMHLWLHEGQGGANILSGDSPDECWTTVGGPQ